MRATLGSGRVSVVCICMQRRVGSPHDTVESCNAEKIPLRGDDPAPELVLC